MLVRRRGVGYYCTCSCLTLHITRRPRRCITSMSRWTKQFQLTPPVKGATIVRVFVINDKLVSTHASREERDPNKEYKAMLEKVSTHASREGRDGISRIHRYDNTQRPRLRDGSRRRWFMGLMRRGSAGTYRRAARTFRGFYTHSTF